MESSGEKNVNFEFKYEASVEFTVRISMPEVDREKGDAKSILAIIIKITEEGFSNWAQETAA